MTSKRQPTAHRVRWWHGWGPLIAFPTAVILWVPSDWPAWAYMWTLALVVYAGCKWLTWRRTPVEGVPLWQHVAYLVAWPGLDPMAFLDPDRSASRTRPTAGSWLFAVGKTAIGFAILYVVVPYLPTEYPYVVGWGGLLGIGMILHFGLFHLLACLWREMGIDARPLMNWPVLSTSLSEYWARRWNTAFRDMTHRFLFRPLTPYCGPRGAILAGFFFSGLIHDMVMSLPARGGYGWPTFFFLVHGSAILISRSRPGRRLGLSSGFRGWLFTTAVVLGSCPALFHYPFVVNVVMPFLRAIGCLS